VADTAKEIFIAFVIAYAAWIALGLILHSPVPLDVVTSCSMLPNLERGDLIIVAGGPVQAPAFKFSGPLESLLSQTTVLKHTCGVMSPSGLTSTYCTHSLVVSGMEIPLNKSNDVIVFDSGSAGFGAIVHRAVARFENGTNVYYFTKGDNNPTIDQESLLDPVPADSIHGRVIGRVPLVGFLKLFLFLQFDEPANCKARLTELNFTG
jgi:hypothetical protein